MALLEWRADFFYNQLDRDQSGAVDEDEVKAFIHAAKVHWVYAHRMLSGFWDRADYYDTVDRETVIAMFL